MWEGGQQEKGERYCHLLVECKEGHELSMYLVGHLHK